MSTHVGIDLGTSNTVLAFRADQGAPSEVLDIPQVVDAGVVETRPRLASFAYLAGPHELAEGALSLPWEPRPPLAVGEFARAQGARVPARLVHSAKSWLCHTGVDRRGPILPYGGEVPDDVTRISPLEASARYLRHVRAAWEAARGEPLGRVVLTVPASFDAAARDLTVEAARAAGITDLVLLEEPQAALYAWLEANEEVWRDALHVGEQVLVVDVGGGTTDLSLIEITEEGGALGLRRVAVGDHILLGGDNMDMTLGHVLRQRVEGDKGVQLERWQHAGLVQSARMGKEALLGRTDVDRWSVTVQNRGARLFKRTVKVELEREEATRILVDGFFPACGLDERPRAALRGGLAQMGLPYAQDPAITRHLAHFLTRHGGRPSAILFNGGVLTADALRQRVVETVQSWFDQPLRVLQSADLDLAVARGAAYYAEVREGRGIRIRGGTARAYYVGVEQPMPAIPGFEPPVSAVCVAPSGMEEGTQVTLPDREFGVVGGEPVRFRFFQSVTRHEDAAGAELEHWTDDELSELEPVETTLAADAEHARGSLVPVGLEAAVTEVGTLVLSCVEKQSGRHHRLELAVDRT